MPVLVVIGSKPPSAILACLAAIQSLAFVERGGEVNPDKELDSDDLGELTNILIEHGFGTLEDGEADKMVGILARLVERAKILGLEPEDLDDLVHDVFNKAGGPSGVSEINNQGLEGQFAYLVEHLPRSRDIEDGERFVGEELDKLGDDDLTFSLEDEGWRVSLKRRDCLDPLAVARALREADRKVGDIDHMSWSENGTLRIHLEDRDDVGVKNLYPV
jgi:hypothetical protein